MENASHASEQLILDGPERPLPVEPSALLLPEDSHPSLFTLEEPRIILFQVAYY